MRFAGPPSSPEEALQREIMYQKWMNKNKTNRKGMYGGKLLTPTVNQVMTKLSIPLDLLEKTAGSKNQITQEYANLVAKTILNQHKKGTKQNPKFDVDFPIQLAHQMVSDIANQVQTGKGLSGGFIPGIAAAALPWLMTAAKTILPALGLGVVGGLGNVFGRKMGGYDNQVAKGLVLPGTTGRGLVLPGTTGRGLVLPGTGGSLSQTKSNYVKYGLTLSTQQKSKIKSAFQQGQPVTIRLTVSSLSGNDIILLTKRQVNRIQSKLKQGKGTEITLTPEQIKENQTAGWLHLIPLIWGGKKLLETIF